MLTSTKCQRETGADRRTCPLIRATAAAIVLAAWCAVAVLPAAPQEWAPSKATASEVIATIGVYFASLDKQDYKAAYAMMAGVAKESIPESAFIDKSREFHSLAGAPLERRLLKVTWYKDPKDAPLPGLYAAVDVDSKYEKIDRHCGYVVLHQQPSAAEFQVIRAESNYIDNATAINIAKAQSDAELDKLWAKMSMNCPQSR